MLLDNLFGANNEINTMTFIITPLFSSCYSIVGRIGGPQTLSLAPKCLNTGTIFHELLHTLGFWHEHTRPDRDKYINVLWHNIEDGR